MFRGIGTNHKKSYETAIKKEAGKSTQRSKFSTIHDWKTEHVSNKSVVNEEFNPTEMSK